MQNIVRKKLNLAPDTVVSLSQIRDGKDIDLEDGKMSRLGFKVHLGSQFYPFQMRILLHFIRLRMTYCPWTSK